MQLRDGYQALQAKGFEIIGVSKDSAKSHQGFIQKQNLPFRLIADTDTTLQEQFGVWAEKKCTDVHTWGLSVPPLL